MGNIITTDSENDPKNENTKTAQKPPKTRPKQTPKLIFTTELLQTLTTTHSQRPEYFSLRYNQVLLKRGLDIRHNYESFSWNTPFNSLISGGSHSGKKTLQKQFTQNPFTAFSLLNQSHDPDYQSSHPPQPYFPLPLLQFKPPHSHFYQEVASNQLESRPPTSPTPLLYPSPLIPLEKLQFSLFLTVLQAFNYFIAQNLHDAEILPFFERPESDYSLPHDENLAYYSRIVPKYFSFVPDEHLNACVEIYNQFHDVYPRYSTYDTPDLASDCNRLRFDRVLDGYHWDFLIWVWNLSEFQKNWVKRHEMDCNFGSLGDVLDKIMDKIHIVSGGKSVGCVDRGGEREITKRKLPGKEKLNLFDFCGEKRVGNKKLEKDDFVDLLEILSWSKSPGDDDNICSLDDGYLWTNEGYADVICAMMNEMEEKAKRWLEMVKENDEQWKRWSKWERHVSRGFKTDKNNDKLTKSDQNDEKYITNAYVFKIPKKYMILRGRNLPWYSGNIPKHIGLNGKMNQSIQNSMREPYKFGNPGDCIYSDDELEGFYNDYLLWARGEGEVMKCNGSYKKNQYDDDKFINNNPDRLRLYDITDYELNDINEGVISQLIQSEFGYGLWGEFFLEDKMFHKTRKNPYIIQQWLKFQPGYEEKYGANGDPREKCLQLFISDFVKLYKCYTNHSFDDFESEKNGQTNQLTLHNTSKRHVVINGGDCDEKPQELLPDKLPERLFWVVPLHEYTKVKSKNNPNRRTVLEENLSLLHKVLNSHLIQFSQQRIDDLKACWEYDVYVLHYLMSLCEEFRDPFRQLAQGNLQAPENELFKSHPFIVRNDLRYFQSLLPNFFTYFNDDGTINHDINPYLTETLRSHAPDSCKITLVFTHIDLFYHQIKTGVSFPSTFQYPLGTHYSSYNGPEFNPDAAREFIVDTFVHLCNSTQFRNNSNPDVVVINTLDRETVLEKFLPYFGPS